MSPLIVDPYSHLHASLLGHIRPAYPVEEMAFIQLDAWIASKRGRNQVAPKRLDRPWEQAKPVATAARSADSQRRRRVLAERLKLQQN